MIESACYPRSRCACFASGICASASQIQPPRQQGGRPARVWRARDPHQSPVRQQETDTAVSASAGASRARSAPGRHRRPLDQGISDNARMSPSPPRGLSEPPVPTTAVAAWRETIFTGLTGSRPGGPDQPPGPELAAARAGAGEAGRRGEDDFVFSLSREEFLDVFFDDWPSPTGQNGLLHPRIQEPARRLQQRRHARQHQRGALPA